MKVNEFAFFVYRFFDQAKQWFLIPPVRKQSQMHIFVAVDSGRHAQQTMTMTIVALVETYHHITFGY